MSHIPLNFRPHLTVPIEWIVGSDARALISGRVISRYTEVHGPGTRLSISTQFCLSLRAAAVEQEENKGAHF